ncbi:hypothetical protein [Paracidovorax anthurii]|uniref:hypothetical protein n=1 Tax=Paracidovorax anthurii TaxID=78229 RepID=UPI0011BDA1CE|nr:hypothetical protein [Paracidovorax anthurii]
MNGLIELVFDGISVHYINGLVCEIIQQGNILEITGTEVGAIDASRLEHELVSMLRNCLVPASMFLKVDLIEVGGVGISSPLLRILSFEGKGELAVLFEASDIDEASRNDAAIKLADGARSLAIKAQAHDFYCGFEPATDRKTRLFSANESGPVLNI